jgi:hypothetical protein
MLERILSNNAERFDDTSWPRLCLSGYVGFVDAVVRPRRADRADLGTGGARTQLHALPLERE